MERKNKKPYSPIEIQIVGLDKEDVVRTSGFYTDWDDFEDLTIEDEGIEPGMGG